ncbi:MAG: hypothetical protein EOM34_05015 [Clostridia bacterium]|nr:hypothetical protein [Lachnospiraceae bacterium]NCC00033.1 hypothetical protein [Clostridia bacterium]NCD01877.1 hypothetical protein [Clostridia bacterium]
MTSLLVVKEKIVGFYKNYEYAVQAVGKFILAFLAFNFINGELGYFEAITGIVPTLFLSVICAVVPVSIFVLIFALVVLLHLFELSMVLSVIGLVVFLLFYFIYLKFAPSQGILIILYPVLAQFNLHYMIPLIGAMAFNPFAALPIAFGVVFMKIVEYLKDAAALGDPGTDVQGIMTSYQYVFEKLLADKEVIAYIVVFTLVILVVYAISRLTVDYAWYIAIAAGTLVNVIGLAMQASTVENINIGMVVIGSIIGGLLAALIRFMSCTLDYARKEMLQFEDDDYYYYVKAVPKLQVTQAERNVRDVNKKPFGKLKKSKKKEKALEETVAKEIPATPPTGDTMVAPPKETENKETVVNDFDELSFDGFDFDELDQK